MKIIMTVLITVKKLLTVLNEGLVLQGCSGCNIKMKK